jgi:hypothetical protein
VIFLVYLQARVWRSDNFINTHGDPQLEPFPFIAAIGETARNNISKYTILVCQSRVTPGNALDGLLCLNRIGMLNFFRLIDLIVA